MVFSCWCPDSRHMSLQHMQFLLNVYISGGCHSTQTRWHFSPHYPLRKGINASYQTVSVLKVQQLDLHQWHFHSCITGFFLYEETWICSKWRLFISGCVNLSFAYVEGESLLMALKDVALSSGRSVTLGVEPSHSFLPTAPTSTGRLARCGPDRQLNNLCMIMWHCHPEEVEHTSFCLDSDDCHCTASAVNTGCFYLESSPDVLFPTFGALWWITSLCSSIRQK